MPTVLLVRHGRTAANASGTLAGWSPGVELDDTGAEQARALAARVAGLPVVALHSSPLTRCLQTADALAAVWDTPVTDQVDLGECRYGAWTGRPLAELATEPLWSAVQQHPSSVTFPASPDFGHESLAAMSTRAVAIVRALDHQIEQEHGADALWAAVSHGDVIKAVLADATGAHLDAFQRFTVGPASLSVVRYTPERPYLLRVNDTGTLDGFAATTSAPAQGSAGVVGGGV
ncbi:MAG: MSMEG_4193 family putative phosphomutase [Mobilicoccus sp.]|nr:MSMEG_4193 family putative phosphomutase [Mobilicoccus sp.]